MTSKTWTLDDDESERERLRIFGWTLLALAITMIVIGLTSLALGIDSINLWKLFGFIGFAHAQPDNTTTTTFPDSVNHFYSSPVINFRTSNATIIHPGQNETIAASCNDNNSLPFAGGWKIVKPGGVLTILQSHPDVNMHAWNITAMNIGSEPVSIQAIVTCIHENAVKPTESTGNATTTTTTTALR